MIPYTSETLGVSHRHDLFLFDADKALLSPIVGPDIIGLTKLLSPLVRSTEDKRNE
jgi:hypothetical protein